MFYVRQIFIFLERGKLLASCVTATATRQRYSITLVVTTVAALMVAYPLAKLLPLPKHLGADS
jgi:hypothetical protein